MVETAARTVDLTNCDREPIHLLGHIQPFGFLIAASKMDWVVEHVSRNIEEWLGVAPQEIIGRPVNSLLDREVVHAIRGKLQRAIVGDTTERMFAVDLAEGLRCDVAVHLAGDSVVIECERTLDDQPTDTASIVRSMVARLKQTEDDRSFYRVAAREMRALTGFDRVMIYRFDQDDSGEVIAESARSGLESYLGLHYPASDIPHQARRLYERNWLRIIPDIHATPSPIEPAVTGHGGPFDLSMSVLRSVSPIHIEYLNNMGVRASMSVSILRDGKLWGLFACHHYEPRLIGFGSRTAAELFGQMFSLMMETRERAAEALYEGRAQRIHQRLITVMAGEAQQFESIAGRLDEVADLLACDGVGLWMDERLMLLDRTPDETEFRSLIDFLKQRGVTDIWARQYLSAEYPPAAAFADRAAGALVVPLSRPARDYLIFFRGEFAQQVNWAGDPAKPVTVGPLGARLTPRQSFALWKETVRGQCRPWTPVERRIAESLRVSLLEVILRLTDVTLDERRRNQSRQELLIAELNHRVRNILNLIRGVITQSKDAAYTVEQFTSVVGGRIQALARAHDQVTAERWGPASFRSLIEAEVGAYLNAKAQRVDFVGPDALISPEAFTTIALVIHEMITNSAKYGALADQHGHVEIATSFDRTGRFVIVWSEHGGPPVRPPSRRGFGSTVIERSIVHDLKGEAELQFLFAGVKARFVIPSSYAELSNADMSGASEARQAEVQATDLPADVLLVEDNMIIALDAEDMLRRLGVPSVRSARGVADAMRLMDERLPDYALLDVNLGDETSFAVADRLATLGAPFAFVSGYGEQAVFPDRFTEVKRIMKPYSANTLAGAMTPRSYNARVTRPSRETASAPSLSPSSRRAKP